MVDILDLIYQVFDDLKEAQEIQDQDLITKKEEELEELRKQLVRSSSEIRVRI